MSTWSGLRNTESRGAKQSEIFKSISLLQDRIGQTLAAKAPDDSWVEIVVNFEIDGQRGREVTDWITFAICKNGSRFKKHRMRFELKVEDLFLELRELYGQLGSKWSTVEITLLRDGRINFEFDYGPPKCPNGDMEAVRRFENYLDGYE